MSQYETLKHHLATNQSTWLITGVAGFIGSNLLETLLGLNQWVVGLDNFGTGFQHNLDEVQGEVSEAQCGNFRFIEGDIRNLEDCRKACEDVDYVLHQAALGSVPRSLEDPITTNEVNISGFLNMLVAARDAKVKRFVYAASSSTYGRTNLTELFDLIKNQVKDKFPEAADAEPIYRDFRAGDVLHSLADISKAEKLMGYAPAYSIGKGMKDAADWYLQQKYE